MDTGLHGMNGHYVLQHVEQALNPGNEHVQTLPLLTMDSTVKGMLQLINTVCWIDVQVRGSFK